MKSFAGVLSILLACPSLLVSAERGYSSDNSTAPFNATQIDMATKEGWCNAQISQCPALCADNGKGTSENICYPKNLAYDCVCDDGVRPNLTEYSEMIPYYICTMRQGECIKGCSSIATCEENCRKINTCGATSPKSYNTTNTTAVLPSATTTTTASATPSGSSSSSSSTFDGRPSSSATSILMEFGGSYGLGLVAAGFSLAFGLIGGI